MALGLGGFGGGVVGGATVRLFLDDREFTGKLKAAEAETKAASTTMGKFGGAAKQAFILGSVAAGAFAVSAVKAYSDQENALAELQGTIERSPKLIGATTQAFEDQALALEHLTGFTDTEILAADNILARFKLNTDQIQQAIPIVLDYARATGQDVPSAAQNIGKALLGNTRALKTVGIQFTATGNTGKDFSDILDLLQSKIGGVSKEFAGTAAGQLAIAKARFHDLQVEVGGALVPVLSDLLAIVVKLMPVFKFAADNALLLLSALAAYKTAQWLPGLFESLSAAITGAVAPTVALTEAETGLAAEAPVAGAAVAEANTEMQATNVYALAAAAAVVVLYETYKAISDPAHSAAFSIGELSKSQQAANDEFVKAHGALAQQRPALAAVARGNQEVTRSLDLLTGRSVAGALATNEVSSATSNAYQQTRIWAQSMREATAAANAQRLAELSLAGGLVGVQAAAAQLHDAQAKLNELEKAGKTDTLAYRAAQSSAFQAFLSLNGAVQDYENGVRKAGGATNAGRAAILLMARDLGISQGAMRAYLGSVSSALGEQLRFNQALRDTPRTIDVTITTHYHQIGSPSAPGKPLP